MANKGFFCLDGYLKRTAKLSDQELGRLFRACMVYHATGEVTELAGRESVAFDFIREDIDAANEAYEAKCETNRRNRIGTVDNDRQRPSTTVDEAQPEPTKGNESPNIKEKEKENIKRKIKERSKRTGTPEPDPGFDRFWEAYPKKVSKEDAVRAFNRIGVDDILLGRILSAIQKQKQTAQWQEDGGRFVPYPATWLNGRRWEDEIQPQRTPLKTIPAQDYTQRDYSKEDEEARRRMLDECNSTSA